jgi:hypothetical protein
LSLDLLSVASANNKLVRLLVASGSFSERLVAPSVDWTFFASNRRLRFTTTVWVVARALDDTANVRLAAKVSALSSLT